MRAGTEPDQDGKPRSEVYVVWEHLVGLPGPRYTESRFRRRLRWHRPASALALFEESNGSVVAELWRLWDKDQPVAVVTFLPPAVAHALASRIDAESIPCTRLVVTTPTDMARLIGLLDTTHIFHALPDQILRYGPRGVYVHPRSPEIMRKVI
ncbi:hypothetical protein [Streptomyces anulatus]|uniref:hypothetical protein n=1 Tax=Streptomyces anulatus TaxID=1892 RepID=UPI003422C412